MVEVRSMEYVHVAAPWNLEPSPSLLRDSVSANNEGRGVADLRLRRTTSLSDFQVRIEIIVVQPKLATFSLPFHALAGGLAGISARFRPL